MFIWNQGLSSNNDIYGHLGDGNLDDLLYGDLEDNLDGYLD